MDKPRRCSSSRKWQAAIPVPGMTTLSQSESSRRSYAQARDHCFLYPYDGTLHRLQQNTSDLHRPIYRAREKHLG